MSGTFNPSTMQTTLTGSTGTAVCSEPNDAPLYKKVMIYLNGYSDTGTQVYSFDQPFQNMPYVYGDSNGVAGASVTMSSVTFNVTNGTGFVFLEGF